MRYEERRCWANYLFARLVSKIFNLCGHDPPTSQTDRRTEDMISFLPTISLHTFLTFRSFSLSVSSPFLFPFPSSCHSLLPFPFMSLLIFYPSPFLPSFSHFPPFHKNAARGFIGELWRCKNVFILLSETKFVQTCRAKIVVSPHGFRL